MTNSAIASLHRGNSKLVIFAFFVTVFFNLTAFKFIWGLELPARVFNFTALVLFTVYFVNTFSKLKLNRKIVYFYIVPGILVFIGYFINLSISSFQNFNILNQFGSLIPWAIYLAVPCLLKFHRLNVFSLWSFFDSFMFATVSLSLAEYFLINFGYISFRPIITSGGNFIAGYFSMLFMLEEGPSAGQIHYRFYASFMEPGTLAMFLLPLIAYTFLHRKYFHLLIYIFALYLTDSLGGFIGFAILIPFLIFLRFHKFKLISLIFCIFSIFIVFNLSFGDLKQRYEAKDLSATVREESSKNFLKYLPQLVFSYPLGLPRTETTEQAMKLDLYTGSNNSLANVYNSGGMISFAGFFSVLFVSLSYAIVSLSRIGISIDEQAAVASIFCSFLFIFQRTSIWESSIFALLYAPFVIAFLRGDNLSKSISRG